MGKKMENEMETGIIGGIMRFGVIFGFKGGSRRYNMITERFAGLWIECSGRIVSWDEWHCLPKRLLGLREGGV